MVFLIDTFDLMGLVIVYVVFAPMILDHNSPMVAASMPVRSRNLLTLLWGVGGSRALGLTSPSPFQGFSC